MDISQVKKILLTQFPEYKDLNIKPIENPGVSHYIFHLGEEMLIRIPINEEKNNINKEAQYLNLLSNNLSIQIPNIIHLSKDDTNCFGIYDYIKGESLNNINLETFNTSDWNSFSQDLVEFFIELHHTNTNIGPIPSAENYFRGAHPNVYHDQTIELINKFTDYINKNSALDIWAKAINTSIDAKPVWIHGDLYPGNIIIDNKRLKAIIDWSGMVVGDPACDLAIAWTVIPKKLRSVFITSINLEEDIWLRAKGWTLWKALVTMNETIPESVIFKKQQAIINVLSNDHN